MIVRVVLLLTFVAAVTWSPSRTPVVAANEPAPTTVSTNNNVVRSCIGCHDGNWSKKYPDSAPYFLGDESIFWQAHDPHIRAYEVLNNTTGQRMAKTMSLAQRDGKIVDARCLSCHAVETKGLPKDLQPRNADFVAANDVGVGCVLCHSTAESASWVLAHAGLEWREKSAGEKTALGLRDLRNPTVKAEMCATCHVGNAAQNKVVTHEMYAAGHPPLPPLELMGFVEHQPRHFKLPEEITGKPIHGQKYDNYRAEHVAVGAIVALKAEADLLAAESAAALKNHALIDYARFDCYACHHDLKPHSGRQERGYKGPPGRPPLKAWNTALASTVVTSAAKVEGAADFAAKSKALENAIFKSPFGDAAAVNAAATELSKWATAFLPKLEAAKLAADPKWNLAANIKAAMLSNEYSADPEAVMALLWAYRALGPNEDWKSIDAKLPSSVRVLTDPKAEKPETAGEVFARRQAIFNKYRKDEFQKLFAK